ncbi:efflux RND transporter periplasmic adaptor subunit [Chromohalobacter sp. HP20-39]|uniref:efflux RND transporter periplasmic adaptor subunit n=1 Tax=Chromohalobacter sp. HP20-39 TaxID=3079306 RepID=UPI00294B8BA1|nr:efflux RND transporter periplasmic adaptor subunit [Chromohalobacter sp. HP20-39]MDV6318239.1 efflux RND transporter periplasmic adaptor subunit [Chromohalobacter sp. HP20-39]
MTLSPHARKVVRPLLTLAMLAIAVVAIAQIWNHYMHDPWTRDGRVRADVINLGTDVAGLVENLQVESNDYVEAGDVLFTIDKKRYALALAEAKANLNNLEQQRAEAKAANARRQKLGDYASQEDRDDARFAYSSAQAQVEQAQVAVEQAKLDLERATVRAPVDGYVTNLLLHPGEYVSVGENVLTLIDAKSFYVLGYFEETKLDAINVGAPVRIQLLAANVPLWGHVDSIAHGISDKSLDSQGNGLANVSTSFDWVRLSQRIPVRIALDDVPDDVQLSAGLTATVYLNDTRNEHRAASDWQRSLTRWWESLISI